MKILEKLAARQTDYYGCKPIVISCIGDSVTHGCFEVFIDERGKLNTDCRADEAYPALLGRALGRMYPFAQPCVLNAGVSGDSAANGRTRLHRDALFAKPDLVIVDFGLNDSMCEDVEGGLKRYTAAMRGIFEGVLETGAECLLLTPNFMCEYVSGFIADEYVKGVARQAAIVQTRGILKRYAEAAKAEARALNVPIADAYAAWEKLRAAGADTTRMLSNHINHPTPAAHQIFADAILRALFSE